jgi:argininosuccinate lyase
VQSCGVDYRSAYEVVGRTVREASERGIAGREITGAMLDEAAIAETGESWGLAAMDLTATLDPRLIIESRRATGGAAPAAVESMISQCEQKADDLAEAVQQRRQVLDRTEQELLARAEHTVGEEEDDHG